MKRVVFALALSAGLAGAACQKSGTEAQREAEKAQATANTEITSANAEADKKSTKAQAEANEKISAGDKDFIKTREDYRHDVQSNLDSVDKKIADIDARAQKGKKVKGDLDAIHAQRDAFAADVQKIDQTDASTFDATKARIDKEWNDLKKAVDRAH